LARSQLTTRCINVSATISAHSCIDAKIYQLIGELAHIFGCGAFGQVAGRRV
jgi:hypothetical protein